MESYDRCPKQLPTCFKVVSFLPKNGATLFEVSPSARDDRKRKGSSEDESSNTEKNFTFLSQSYRSQ
ncbi:hypothetical protein FRX31_020814, partial [Thalictrum thalictroides]